MDKEYCMLDKFLNLESQRRTGLLGILINPNNVDALRDSAAEGERAGKRIFCLHPYTICVISEKCILTLVFMNWINKVFNTGGGTVIPNSSTKVKGIL